MVALLVLAGCATNPLSPVRQPTAQIKPTPQPQVAAKPAGPTQPVRVALLLPLTGSNATLGQAMQDAANLAVFDQADKSFTLLPEDTGDTPDRAGQAATHAIAEGAKLIIGPIFAGAVAQVGPIAASAHVPVVSFTTDIAQANGNVFVTGFLPGSEVKRVVSYAQGQGVQRFAVLAPDNAYGALTVSSLQELNPGATVLRYKPGTNDFTALAQQLKAATPQAILLPEGGADLHAIAKAFAASGIDPHQVHLLGTGLWDDAGLGQEAELQGAWYAGTAPAARADFEKRFFDTYKYKPQRLCTLAYDATALAIVLGKQGSFDKAAITKPSGFAGLDGVFRLGANGQIERALSVLAIAPTGPVVIDPAPKSFATANGAIR